MHSIVAFESGSQTNHGTWTRRNIFTLHLQAEYYYCAFLQEEAIPILGSFLRKNQRALKLCSLPLLDTLVRNYSSALHPDLLDKVKNVETEDLRGAMEYSSPWDRN